MPKDDIPGRFAELFGNFVDSPKEEWLASISDIGRELVHASFPPEEIGDLFEFSLKKYSLQFPDVRLSDVTEKIPTPLTELLIAYGLAFRQQLEHQRIYEETRLAGKIMENSVDGIWMADGKRNIQIVNPSFCRITGYEADEIIGKNVAILHGLSQNDIVIDKIWEIIDKESLWKGELASRRKNGEIYPALFSISVIRDNGNQIANYIGVLNDMSEKHQEESIRLELERAREIYNLVVQPQLPEMEGVEINVKCIPAQNIGGDIMEIVKVDEKTLVIFMADITGHGVSAAMTANTLKMLFKEVTETTVEPDRIFKYLNGIMYKNILPDDLIAAFCGQIDLNSMNLTYCLNGLPDPLIYRDQTTLRLKPTGFPLGVFEEMTGKCETVKMEHGDIFLVFTDGITEAMNQNGELFGIDGIQTCIGEKKRDVQSIVEDILNTAIEFQNRESFSDDIFVVAVNLYEEEIRTNEISHTNTYSFPTKSVCRGKTKFLFIDEVVEFFMSYVSEKTGQHEDDLGWLRISLFEMVLNAIEHGNLEITPYKRDPEFYDSPEYWKIFNERMNSLEFGNRKINIECSYTENKIEIVIEDEGKGFDAAELESPTEGENLEKPSGRGIALTRMNLDKLTYNTKGNKVTLMKYL